MPSAFDSFLSFDCDTTVAGWLRTELAIGASDGLHTDTFEFNTFDVEVAYTENRVTVTEAAALGLEPSTMTIAAFLNAIPDAPTGQRMPGYPRRVIIPPPPCD